MTCWYQTLAVTLIYVIQREANWRELVKLLRHKILDFLTHSDTISFRKTLACQYVCILHNFVRFLHLEESDHNVTL